ncbi:hypothetical protein Droror1_Dr00001485 [Drosera rotundifolia]
MLSSITFIFSLIFLVSIPVGVIDPAIAGLAVTYGLNLNTLQAWVIWSLCMMENKIISVERILQYCEIPNEPPLVIEDKRPDASSPWPSHGEIDIQDLQVRYAPHMPLVLQGITCTFHGGKKTGIVGRTGSGKSTLIQTLFRIVEPAAGRIVIDGIDICTIGLHDLRSRLSIIPQEPTMFEGTWTILCGAAFVPDLLIYICAGLVEEFDSPMNLLGNKSSSFSKLVAEYSSRSKSSHT